MNKYIEALLADCVAGRSLAGHTGCRGSFGRV